MNFIIFANRLIADNNVNIILYWYSPVGNYQNVIMMTFVKYRSQEWGSFPWPRWTDGRCGWPGRWESVCVQTNRNSSSSSSSGEEYFVSWTPFVSRQQDKTMSKYACCCTVYEVIESKYSKYRPPPRCTASDSLAADTCLRARMTTARSLCGNSETKKASVAFCFHSFSVTQWYVFIHSLGNINNNNK